MDNKELIETSEKAYTTKDVAMMTDLAEPTVKKYAQALEAQGYQFAKSKRGKIEVRLFVERDILYLKKMYAMSKKTNTDVKSLAQMVMVDVGQGKQIRSVSVTDTPTVTQKDIVRYENRFQELQNSLKPLEKIDTLQTELKNVYNQNELLKKMLLEMGKQSAQKQVSHEQEVKELKDTLKEMKQFMFQLTQDQRKSDEELKQEVQKVLELTRTKEEKKKGLFGWFK